MKVGFIGLGRMGSGMANRLLSGGYELAVFDAVTSQISPLVSAGARAASSVADVCADCEIVITMLVEDATVLDVALGKKGICDSLSSASIHLVMGTQLGIVAAGSEAAMDRVQPLLNAMGRRTFRAGNTPESATAIKLANNAVLGCAMVAMAEGFALVRKYGVVPQVFQDVMTEGLFSAPAYKVYGQKMVDESFDQVGSPIHVGLKDANLIAAAADLARVPMPSHNVYRDRLLGAVAHGDENRDQAVLAREQARASGLA
jgi:3-hydroxyisobutyrate dehydrogenase-like beta-hydroxyacid dehydrogenase